VNKKVITGQTAINLWKKEKKGATNCRKEELRAVIYE
jgi:hypothetical protein